MTRPPRPDECDCCGFETKELAYYEPHNVLKSDKPGKWLCKLCAGTMAGVSIEYPELYGDHVDDILKAICYVGNAIIAAVRAK